MGLVGGEAEEVGELTTGPVDGVVGDLTLKLLGSSLFDRERVAKNLLSASPFITFFAFLNLTSFEGAASGLTIGLELF